VREAVLVPDAADGSRWLLPGVGVLRRTGRVSRAATAEAGGRTWTIARRGLVRPGFTAADETGAVVGARRDGLTGRGEDLRWAGRRLTLRPDGDSGGHVLCDGGRRLARMASVEQGRRPLAVVIDDPATDAGLLLFVAFIVQAYSDDASFAPPAPTA